LEKTDKPVPETTDKPVPETTDKEDLVTTQLGNTEELSTPSLASSTAPPKPFSMHLLQCDGKVVM